MMDPSVFRTSNKKVLRVYEDWKKAARKWQEKREILMKELDPTGKRGAMVSRSGGRMVFLGMEHKNDLEVPLGWRLDREHSILVPRRSTSAGKQIVQRIEDVCPPLSDPRGTIPGMPHGHLGLGEDKRMYYMHPGIERHGGWLYAVWGTDEPPISEIDLKIWKSVKLSAYYALVEKEKIDEVGT